ncbi:hypothetical protein DUNSADRAFT_7346 [Dunaliella salina]|uniref:Uncharacterized protein n=1 Tax=Dunaliella salina TaxID=3046 RepID=A0ABQ7GLH4_DUNSA|nr:hypothetical protein DUNSADRAFT_7346 [Dunaliella salina]|eukprot:KAF5835457.1 hypothetical protein DUNSADRAFT_7346 [Dunaliella salina]
MQLSCWSETESHVLWRKCLLTQDWRHISVSCDMCITSVSRDVHVRYMTSPSICALRDISYDMCITSVSRDVHVRYVTSPTTSALRDISYDMCVT